MRNTFKNFGADINVLKNDAEEYEQGFEEKFDKVIVDAPCSGLGVIKRKPEILLRLSLDDINKLIAIQRNILKNAARYVKKSGTLLYCTCSISPEENELQIRKFLEENDNFSLSEMRLPEEFYKNANIAPAGEIAIYPGDFAGDGFYICRLTKS
jgi:16S rRNA (cytosine967-C5)-methyltransferase